ncbi:hypothetical protein BDV96DRAFT_607013 [Lophiotrema nucula]|uniref:SRR1-like domain-containing protein n=1 Tax=Lophiotrema nucula TaxID=690887 RepID=A0A6A5YLD0_9PLEO|nr:hypothetical protein BDV96DRAFT_607013 [Lophiotrema nucula]
MANETLKGELAPWSTSTDIKPEEGPEMGKFECNEVINHMKKEPWFTMGELKATVTKLRDFRGKKDTVLEVNDWQGEPHPATNTTGAEYQLDYNTWQAAGNTICLKRDAAHACPFYVREEYPQETKARTEACLPFDKEAYLNENFARLKLTYENSDYCAQLKAYLAENKASMKEVKQIICIGLGNFLKAERKKEDKPCDNTTEKQQAANNPGDATSVNKPDESTKELTYVPNQSHFYQYLLACTVREAFESGPDTPLPIYAQDPLICVGGRSLLKDYFNITVIGDPEAFVKLTENTFIITVWPWVPVRQLAVDLLDKYGGPAGMLCEEIMNNGTHCNGVEYVNNSDEEEDLWTLDPSSPRLEEYKKKCFGGGYRLEDELKIIKPRPPYSNALYLLPKEAAAVAQG